MIDLESKKEVRHLKFHDKGIFHLAFIQPQNLVCAACADGSISVWNATDWSLVRTLKISSRKVRRLAVNVSGSLMAAACGDGMVRVFETVNFALVQELDHKNEGVNSVAFFENDDLITGGKDAHLRTWAAHNGFELKEDVPAHNFAIYDLIIEPNGNFLATVSRDKTVKIWPDCQLESPIRLDRAKSEGHLNSVNVALWIPEENVLATAGDDRSIVLWKIT